MPGGLDILIEPKVRAILKTLQKSPGKLFHLNSLAKYSDVSISSTVRIILKLLKSDFVEEVKIGKWSIYRSFENDITNNHSCYGLIEPKTRAVLKTLLKSPNQLFHLNSLAKSSRTSVSSTARIVEKLVKNGFAEEMKIGKWSVYKLVDNENIRGLVKLL